MSLVKLTDQSLEAFQHKRVNDKDKMRSFLYMMIHNSQALTLNQKANISQILLNLSPNSFNGAYIDLQKGCGKNISPK